MRPDHPSDPWAVLGLAPGASVAEVLAARRRMAKDAHPDRGGSEGAMQAVNAAAERALALLRAGARPGPDRRSDRPSSSPSAGGRRVDHPSFTVEALPVDAFEALLLVGAELGTVVDDDPPYRLELALEGDVRGWCQISLVPDAGATTASLAVAPEPGTPCPSVEVVRDLLVGALNRLDWSDGPHLPPP